MVFPELRAISAHMTVAENLRLFRLRSRKIGKSEPVEKAHKDRAGPCSDG